MERELAEETGVGGHDVRSTRVVGFGRWIERGAKPEFFGVSYLSISSRELADRYVKISERLYTGRVRALPVDFPALKRSLLAGASIAHSSSCPEDIRNSGSVPLLVGLRFAVLEWE
ncbi:hypothetical protein SAMN05421505_10340 [Sinosporangium album]|uniref:Nudix hydrolase domain-containing protein n=1 Tax=Sinosporangium album TaxID=504805 RepID=A0A1G7T025_9ACTN|nr:hypothetical protein [Sinosporangium album]SDG28571.1 hypothetical protein SAMN05421505_10340 [Sinosporangium album]